MNTQAKLLMVLIMMTFPACASHLSSLAPGTSQTQNPTDGLVFGRITIFRDGQDRMVKPFNREFSWWLSHEESGARFFVKPLTKHGPFVLNLPGGHYRVTKLLYEDGGEWIGQLPSKFIVRAGHATYLGTWMIQFLSSMTTTVKVKGSVVDQLPQAQLELTQVYTGSPKPISVILLDSSADGILTNVSRPGVD
jgi:hypothetical protein